MRRHGKPFLAPAREAAPDKRETIELSPSGDQRTFECPVCFGQVTLKKASRSEGETSGPLGNPHLGVKHGDFILRKHRPGGGRFSPRRDQVICDGYGAPIDL